MKTCDLCAKEYDYDFDFSLAQYHKKDETSYQKMDFDSLVLCSKHCIADFVQQQTYRQNHTWDTFIVQYDFPIGFCDKCGHATHPTEFCQQLNDYEAETLDFHERHMAGQGAMVPIKGHLIDVFLGKGWMLCTQGIRYESTCVQLVPSLKERVPLAVLWNNEEELKTFLPTISIPGTEHKETKDFMTCLFLKPSPMPKHTGECLDRYFYVFQVAQHVGCMRKLFFPFQLAMENCWFPQDIPQAKFYQRYYFTNLKSQFFFPEDYEWQNWEVNNFLQLEEEDLDCFEDFKKGMEIIQNKENLIQDLHVNLKDLEDKMSQHVYIGTGRELVQHAEGDNVLTTEDLSFLEEKGFDPSVLDQMFMDQMKIEGLEGPLEESKIE